jgi:hypothetical protein
MIFFEAPKARQSGIADQMNSIFVPEVARWTSKPLDMLIEAMRQDGLREIETG